jgi:flagellar hook-length control protein FliK
MNLIVAQWTKARLNPESPDVHTGLPELTAVNAPQDRSTTEALALRTPRAETDTSTLSQKFAEQLGQRLTRELSNTPWRAELELHPKSLGRIDIQLDFVNGQLEGHFQSGNALTRELMQDSLPRLRELLQNSGHTNVQLDVGSGGASSSGERGSAHASGDGQAPKIRITQGEESHQNSPMKSQSEEGFDLFV